MKILELFAGTRSISREFEKNGHEVYTIEWDSQHENISRYDDINNVTAEEILRDFGRPDVIWASPDCSTYSVAAIGRHRKREENGNLKGVTEKSAFADKTNRHVMNLIRELDPMFYFVENPRGAMRKMDFIQDFPRYTVTYCKYGETRMKPTDIWTNHPNPQFRPACKNGDKCHESAPRGSRTGTQKLKGSVERSRIPQELCRHIVDICEEYEHHEKV